VSAPDQTRHVESGPEDRRREDRKRDRQMIELLNELRVALPGVQILFAFLLTVPFSMRFPDLTAFQTWAPRIRRFSFVLSPLAVNVPPEAARPGQGH